MADDGSGGVIEKSLIFYSSDSPGVPIFPLEGLYPSHTLGDALFPGFLVRLDLLRYILKALLPFAEHFGALLSGPSQANHAKPESAV